MSLAGRKVALAVCGSIAAYKAVEVARLLIAEGVAVTPLMSRASAQFLGPLTLAGICGAPVIEDMFDARFPGEVHVSVGREVDAVLVVPATADVLARLASGRADDVITALVLCTHAPVLVAPAMHARMWSHPATQRNVAQLEADGRVRFIGPVSGPLASGESGMGRLAEPSDIALGVALALAPGDLAGLRVVVTAGPTVEDLDPVRFLSNRSTGKMGFAIAERAALRGADVTLLAGPVSLATPRGVRRLDFRSVADLDSLLARALGAELEGADVLVMAAAVGDYAPRERKPTKLKKGDDTLHLELVATRDLLASVGERRRRALPILVGFALETVPPAELVAYAAQKRVRKKVDLVVANHAEDSFGHDTNRATFVTADGAEPLGAMSKAALGDRILDRVRALAAAHGAPLC